MRQKTSDQPAGGGLDELEQTEARPAAPERKAAASPAQPWRCDQCAAAVFSADPKEEVGSCRFNPPVHDQFMVPQTMSSDRPPFTIEGKSQFPFVKRDWFCINGFRLRKDLQQ